jgi:hypothetical protein
VALPKVKYKPALTSPVTVTVSAAGGDYTVGAGVDANVILPSSIVNGRVTITGGRRLYISGGAAGTAGHSGGDIRVTTADVSCLRCINQTEEVWVEGVSFSKFDGSGGATIDGNGIIVTSTTAAKPDIYLLNCRGDGFASISSFLVVTSVVGRLIVDGCSFRTFANGIYTGTSGGWTSWTTNRLNARYGSTATEGKNVYYLRGDCSGPTVTGSFLNTWLIDEHASPEPLTSFVSPSSTGSGTGGDPLLWDPNIVVPLTNPVTITIPARTVNTTGEYTVTLGASSNSSTSTSQSVTARHAIIQLQPAAITHGPLTINGTSGTDCRIWIIGGQLKNYVGTTNAVGSCMHIMGVDHTYMEGVWINQNHRAGGALTVGGRSGDGLTGWLWVQNCLLTGCNYTDQPQGDWETTHGDFIFSPNSGRGGFRFYKVTAYTWVTGVVLNNISQYPTRWPGGLEFRKCDFNVYDTLYNPKLAIYSARPAVIQTGARIFFLGTNSPCPNIGMTFDECYLWDDQPGTRVVTHSDGSTSNDSRKSLATLCGWDGCRVVSGDSFTGTVDHTGSASIGLVRGGVPPGGHFVDPGDLEYGVFPTGPTHSGGFDGLNYTSPGYGGSAPAPACAGTLDASGNLVWLPPAQSGITGTIFKGVPSGGDYVTAAETGLNYVQPGYEADVIPAVGTITGTLPRMTSSLSGIATPQNVGGIVTGTLPVVTSALAGASTPASTSGIIAGTLPRVTAALSGTMTIPAVGGLIAGPLPRVTAALSGAMTLPVTSGIVTGTLPKLRSALTGEVGPTPIGAILAASLRAVTGSITAATTGAPGLPVDPLLVHPDNICPLTSPLQITLPAGGGTVNLGAGQHATIILNDGAAAIAGTVQINGVAGTDNRIQIIGGQIVNADEFDGAGPNSHLSHCIKLNNVARAYLEGLRLDKAHAAGDCISVGGTWDVLCVQNCLGLGINWRDTSLGHAWDQHGDFLQLQTQGGLVILDRVTFYTWRQGVLINSDLGTPNRISALHYGGVMRRVNGRVYDTSQNPITPASPDAVLYFLQDDCALDEIPWWLSSVYAKDDAPTPRSLPALVMPSVAFGGTGMAACGANFDSVNNRVSWPVSSLIRGSIVYGLPAGGDYVASNFTGLGYQNTMGYDVPPTETSQHGVLSVSYDHVPTILELLEDAARSVGLPVPGTDFSGYFPHTPSVNGAAVDGQWYDDSTRLVLDPEGAAELWWAGRLWELNITQLVPTPDNVGPLVAVLPKVTASLAGVHAAAGAVDGLLAGTLPAVTGALDGLVNNPVATPPRTGGGSLRRRFYASTKTSGTLSER